MSIGMRYIVKHCSVHRNLVSAAALTLGSVIAAAVPLTASQAQPVVQPLGDAGRANLNAALARLARNPRDVDALIDAGAASLAAGDGDAAIGFYQKADAIALPGNARVKAGLAGAYVLSGDPVSAFPLFDQAERYGGLDPARVADRGLAYDLIGDPLTAQGYYRQALAAAPSDETSRRLALSQAVAGDRRGMEVTLGPLLQRQDKAAWRIRSFALAILGQVDEAESITRSTMPANLADSVAAYLRYMPRLTAAQQAAAANLGLFPRAAEIGQNDPRFAQYVRSRPALASADRSLPPAGPALGQKYRDDRKARDRQRERPGEVSQTSRTVSPAAAVVVPAARLASIQPEAPAPTRELPALAAPAHKAQPAVAPPAAAQRSAVLPAPALPPAVTATEAGPSFASLDGPARPVPSSFNLKQVATTAESAAANRPVAHPPPVPAPQAPVTVPVPKPVAVAAAKLRSLSDVFADLTPPSREAVPQVGAVDLRKLKPLRYVGAAEKDAADKACVAAPNGGFAHPDRKSVSKGKAAKRPPKTKESLQCKDGKADAPVNPSRIWVQVATGRDKRALGADWHRLIKAETEVMRGKSGFTSSWGQTNRLLTGPFESEAKASAFISQLRKAGMAGPFAWSSPAGQVVDPLVVRK